MNDRELLEMSAKAAGIEYQFDDDGDVIEYFGGGLQLAFNGAKWNPLTDDGDALRLAVKLRMMIDFITQPNSWMVGCTVAVSSAGNFYEKGFTEEAVRRAIVRAAAEIGKAMS